MLPQVLFVVMPLFALILKIFYLFKRRLYMEHLIVALHSHAFIFLSLLFITLMIALKKSLAVSAPWLATLLDWLIFFAAWWIPVYLFVMQKRVYKQGWIMTTHQIRRDRHLLHRDHHLRRDVRRDHQHRDDLAFHGFGGGLLSSAARSSGDICTMRLRYASR